MDRLHRKTLAIILLLLLSLPSLQAQQEQGIALSGSIQSDVLVPQKDEAIGAPDYSEWALTNTFAELHLQSRYVDAGARFEYLQHPLPGFESDYAGWGVPHVYVRGRMGKATLTLGDYYEQFGSGFILRTYEERSLGIDNALRGGHLVWKPTDKLTLKALTGRQRHYWDHNDAWLTGFDGQYDVVLSGNADRPLYLTLGASYVNKHESDEDIMVDNTHRLNLPENTHAVDARIRLQQGAVSVLAEYAYKTQDPHVGNGYIYRNGYVAMLSASYSRKGASLLLQAKRADNMMFRSQRKYDKASNASMVNHLPAFTLDHTYALPALYPYATQYDGEWAFQAEGSYQFKRRTALGGRYGTTVKLNVSHIHSPQKEEKLLHGLTMGSDGYTSKFFSWGGTTYYQDIDVQIEKKLSPDLKLNLMYMNQFYNMGVIEGGTGGMVHSDIVVGEGKYRISPKLTLRGEAQYLFTADDEGDWAFGLLELSALPHWMLTVSDQYNVGLTHEHYYQASVTFNTGAHRLQAGYGRTRAGYNCSGGVCRYVPATRGFTFSYNYNF
ncbi:MAG: hypothetical protein IJ588_13985 [Prevotella sp.]|nr:hypothetical protein [Prevotella sp.]